MKWNSDLDSDRINLEIGERKTLVDLQYITHINVKHATL